MDRTRKTLRTSVTVNHPLTGRAPNTSGITINIYYPPVKNYTIPGNFILVPLRGSR